MAPTASKSLFWWIELIDFLVETKSAMYLLCQSSNVALKPKNHQTVDDYKFKDKKIKHSYLDCKRVVTKLSELF